MKKYNVLTDYQINEGLKNGRFREEGILIRNALNGETVKVRSLSRGNESNIPPTFIQVNHTTVYQTDLEPVLNAIIMSRNGVIFHELENYYSILIDKLAYYVTYKTMLSDVLSKSIEACSVFENSISKFTKELNIYTTDSDSLTQYRGAISAYTHAIFIQLVSTFLTNNQEFKRDKIIISKIITLRSLLSEYYEKLLCTMDSSGNIELDDSMYASIICDERYDINQIENIVYHDKRIGTIKNLLSKVKYKFTKEIDQTHYDRMDYKIKTNKSIDQSKDKKYAMIIFLANTLYDIEKLEKLREEILSIDDDELLTLVKSGIPKLSESQNQQTPR